MGNIETRVAVLASGDRQSGGGGTTMNRVIRDTLEEAAGFQIGVVICNNPPDTVGIYSVVDEINKDFGLTGNDQLDVVEIGPHTHPGGKQKRGQTLDESAAICRELERRDIGFVSMLGYMRILTGELMEEWGHQPVYGEGDMLFNGIYHPKSRIISNHPSILPFTADKHGEGAHALAIDLYKQGKITRSAMTWHMAAPEIDGGPVVYAEPIDIFADDDADKLGDRVRETERFLTALVIERHLALREEQIRGNL
jgi:folate-dependent phosphoribosylglycinamide formyltransferase PurN